MKCERGSERLKLNTVCQNFINYSSFGTVFLCFCVLLLNYMLPQSQLLVKKKITPISFEPVL